MLYKFVRFLEEYKGSTINRLLSDGKQLCLNIYCEGRNKSVVFDLVEGSIYFPDRFDGKEVFTKLNGSKIVAFKQRGYDRVFYIQVAKVKPSGMLEYLKLVFELVGGNSNFFILDEENTIIYAFSDKNIDQDRSIKIGAKYQVFKNNKRYSLDSFDDLRDFNQLEGFYKKTGDFANRLIVECGDFEKTVVKIKELLSDGKVFIDENGKIYPFKLSENMLEMEIGDYRSIKRSEKKVSFDGVIKQLKEKISKKTQLLDNLKKELSYAENYREFFEKADLIKSNLYRLDEALETGEFFKFSDKGEEKVYLSLKEIRDPDIYLDELYNKGRKLERSVPLLRKRINEVEREIEFYKELLYYVEQGSIDYEEFTEILKPEQKVKLAKKSKQKRYLRYYKDGFVIFVGKNSFGNDEILSMADRDDFWFHVQGSPSSHVILKKREGKLPQYDFIFEVCRITAFFSPLKLENKVPVDWTERKYVRKVKGAAKGFVIYDNFKTMLVTPASPEDLGFKEIVK